MLANSFSNAVTGPSPGSAALNLLVLFDQRLGPQRVREDLKKAVVQVVEASPLLTPGFIPSPMASA